MEIQQGNERASYGKSVLENLSKKLTNEFGKGFSVDNLEKTRKFIMYFQIPKHCLGNLSCLIIWN